MGQSADQVREAIDQHRSDAGDKIDQLQNQIQGSADQMRGQVQDSADHVREQVQGTVDDTIQTVKDQVSNIDFQQQIQERPLVALGAAFLGGMVLGSLTSGGGQHHGSSQPSNGQQGHPGGGVSDSVRSAVHKSGFDDIISSATAALMGSVTDQLKGTLNQNFPGFSRKMDTAQEQRGSLADKARATQSPTA